MHNYKPTSKHFEPVDAFLEEACRYYLLHSMVYGYDNLINCKRSKQISRWLGGFSPMRPGFELRLSIWDDMWSPGETSMFSPETPVSPRGNTTGTPLPVAMRENFDKLL